MRRKKEPANFKKAAISQIKNDKTRLPPKPETLIISDF